MKRSFAFSIPAVSLLALGLAACATPTVFAPMTRPGASGFSETRIQSDRYRVTFRGGSDAGRERVADLTLLRAAELTVDSGYDWFRVVDRYGEAAPPRGPTLSVGGGGESFGRHSGGGVGVGIGGIPLGGGPILSETLEIQMAKGPAPREPDAYDARDIEHSIRP